MYNINGIFGLSGREIGSWLIAMIISMVSLVFIAYFFKPSKKVIKDDCEHDTNKVKEVVDNVGIPALHAYD